MTGAFWLVVMGYAIAASTMSIPGRYFATFLLTSGSSGTTSTACPLTDSPLLISRTSGYALTMVWLANAVPRPPAKRSAAIAIVNSFGGVGSMCVLHLLFQL